MFLIALFVVLPILWLLLVNWQLTLVGLAAWLLVRIAAARRRPESIRELPRWSAGRRLDAEREHAEWQRWFDARR